MKVLIKEKLELLLQSKWTEFLDRQQLLRLCLEYVRDTAYNTLKQEKTIQLRISVTKFIVTESFPEFEMWVEFTIPKDNGVVIGTHVFALNLNGEINLKETHGTHFVIETT